MTDDDEIERELRKAGLDAPTVFDLDAVRRFCTMGLFSVPIAAEIVATGRPPVPRRRRLLDRIRRALVDLLSDLIDALEPPSRHS